MFKFLIVLTIFYIFTILNVSAEEIGIETGYKIPRFVSLKSDEVNLRIGSSKNYPIILKYTFKNLPVKIVDEFQNWRKVIDIEGNQGWIHKSLIKGDRYGIINKENSKILSKPNGKLIGKIGKKRVVALKKCLLKWCLISYNNHSGWINKKNIWGVEDKETIKVPFYQFVINAIWKINL